MQKIKIVSDTASDITIKEAEALGILILPFKVLMGDKEYKEGYDFSKEDFYKMLAESENIPTHSQVTPFEYLETIINLYNEGYEHIVIVPINQNGSSTFQSALTARMQFMGEYPDAKIGIHIINGLTYTNGYGYPVKHAAELASKNGDIDEVLKFFEEWFSRFELYFTTFELKYAKHSGRIGKAAAIAGELLGIKPIICLTAGESVTAQKVRSIPKAMENLIEIAKERIGSDGVYTLVTGDNEKEFKEFKKLAKAELKKNPIDCTNIGACISINAGPQVLGIGFLGEKREMQVIY